MPSHPPNQFSDLEDMMSKQFLGLNLGEHNGLLGMRAPECVSESCRSPSLSLSCLLSGSAEGTLVTSGQWSKQPVGASTQWRKLDFLNQRSLSMVETRSPPGWSAGWSKTEMKLPPCDTSLAHSNPAAPSSSGSSASSRYKTELCRSFTESGLCKYGGKCQFAHGAEELRDLNRHPKYKTEPCRTFHTTGFCPYGIRCHFIHNGEEERTHASSRASSRPQRPPLVRQSFSFAGFPSAPQLLLSSHNPPPTSSFKAASPSCADIADLFSGAFLELDSAFEASPSQQCHPSVGHGAPADSCSPFMPSPDSGYSPCLLSPSGSPSLTQSPTAAEALPGSLGARSLSYTSLSDRDPDGGSSTGSLSGSDSCGGSNEANGKRLAVFSQLSVPEDAEGFCL